MKKLTSAPALTALAIIWSTVVWIAVDMYLPALPTLKATFPVAESTINAGLLTYGLAQAFGSLLAGPVSDRVGRKIPIIIGGSLFVAGNIICVFSPSIQMLNIVRIFAGFGGGSICAIIVAVLKDCLSGDTLDKSITLTQSLIVMGPLVAPFLGSLVLFVVGWRGIFGLLAILGVICLVWTILLPETLARDKRADVSIPGSLILIARVGKNASFTLCLLALCTPALCVGVFLTTSSYIYIDFFGLSSFGYSVYYGLTVIIQMVAPFIYLFLHKHTTSKVIAFLCASLTVISGIAMLLVGKFHPLVFLLACFPLFWAEGMSRPCSYLVLLRQADDTAGSASALINFVFSVFVAIGTPLASAAIWQGNHIVATGGSTLACGIAAFILLALLLLPIKSKILDD